MCLGHCESCPFCSGLSPLLSRKGKDITTFRSRRRRRHLLVMPWDETHFNPQLELRSIILEISGTINFYSHRRRVNKTDTQRIERRLCGTLSLRSSHYLADGVSRSVCGNAQTSESSEKYKKQRDIGMTTVKCLFYKDLPVTSADYLSSHSESVVALISFEDVT